MEQAKISSKGQLVIPKYLRDALGFKEGATVMMEKVENKLIILRKPDDPVRELASAGERIAIKNVRRHIKEE
jgi:AbrB family looped-hinge helix DNA binding protein